MLQTTREARLGQLIASMPEDFRPALNAYAEVKGRNWPRKLTEDWAAGRDDRFPQHGHMLRRIRNSPEHARAITRAAW